MDERTNRDRLEPAVLLSCPGDPQQIGKELEFEGLEKPSSKKRDYMHIASAKTALTNATLFFTAEGHIVV